HIANRGAPVALPMPVDPTPQAPNAKPGGPAQRPSAGPVVPLTATNVEREELLGAPAKGQQRTPTTDAVANRVLTKGEPIAGPGGRADDFSWPRGSGAATEPTTLEPAPAAPAPGAAKQKPATTAAPAGSQRAATDAQAQTKPGEANAGQAQGE